MKKTAIVLSLILSAFIISSCAENNPNNPNDPNTDNSTKITLAQRVGTYSAEGGLSIVFNNNGEVTGVTLGTAPLPAQYPIVVGQPTDTAKEYSFAVTMVDQNNKPTGVIVNVKVIFDSDTEATGGNAYIGMGGEPNMDSPLPIKKVS
ncbi:hypothetical protein R4J09_08990 [Brachyspira intermedia]|uniref:hypothetical protein n=1 Tax=Brachyspira intermedia TaxID=84377 RepID=UPI003007439A